jgi:hypothetical protein
VTFIKFKIILVFKRKRTITPRDKYNAKIECKYCKSAGFESIQHNSNECFICFGCGSIEHLIHDCPLNKNNNLSQEKVKTPNKYRSARRSVLIDNSEHMKENEIIAIDVEKVRGPDNKLLPGWIAIVKHVSKPTKKQKPYEQIILSAKIRQILPNEKDYLTPFSGLTPQDLSENAIEMSELRPKIKRILERAKLIVGIGLNEDIQCLGVGREFCNELKLFDFRDYFLDDNNQPIGLKFLAYGLIGLKIQEFEENVSPFKAHDPIKDALASLRIYRHYKASEKQSSNYQWVRDKVKEALTTGKLTNNKDKKK